MKRVNAFALITAGAAMLAVLYACSGDDTNSSAPPGTPTPDSSVSTPDVQTITPNDTSVPTPVNDANQPPTGDANQPPPTPTCFSGTPTTYLEIINACTDAQSIAKVVDLSSMNLADGGLQPLP